MGRQVVACREEREANSRGGVAEKRSGFAQVKWGSLAGGLLGIVHVGSGTAVLVLTGAPVHLSCSLLCELAEALPAGGRLVAVLGHHAAGGSGVSGRCWGWATMQGTWGSNTLQKPPPQQGGGETIRHREPTSQIPNRLSRQLTSYYSPQQGGGGAVRNGVAAAVAPHGHRLLKHGTCGGPVASAVRLVACERERLRWSGGDA